MSDEKLPTLTPRMAAFVSEYLKDSNGAQAAIRAGYSARSAKDRAHNLLNHSPAVKAAVQAAREDVLKRGEYNLEKAMAECDKAIEFSIQSKSAMAYVRAIELKARLAGLVDRTDISNQVAFQIVFKGVSDGSTN